MAIDFSKDRMLETIDTHEKWWNRRLDRPLTKITLREDYEKRTPAPILSQSTCKDFSWSAEQIIDALDEELSHQQYLGDAFPFVNLSAFGPGVLAAFCGVELDNSSGRVWFFPREKKEIQDIHIAYDPENVYAKRLKAIYKAGTEKWQGSVIMGMTDLGGILDVVATFDTTQKLLTDLIDEEDEVLRLVAETEKAWYDAYWDLSASFAGQGGYSDWSGILSKGPAYVAQCDFCYMIGNRMFGKFVLPSIENDVNQLSHVIYHLDGRGEIKHLDSLLRLEKLDAIQWQYGDGEKADPNEWPEIYEKIAAAGKLAWLVGSPEQNNKLIAKMHGSPYVSYGMDKSRLEYAKAILAVR